jgi:rhodanese-related sulfurtransferase
VLAEACIVALAGAALAFAANALSPRGLTLTRNYFPTAHAVTVPGSGNGSGAITGDASRVPSGLDLLSQQLRQEGLGLADSNLVIRLFQDPRYQTGSIIFVDARDDDHYQRGHIPGAYQLDYYHPAPFLGTVLPACQIAEQIVVYCNGGDCEDSKHTAIFLRDAGVPASKLFVYAGGITEWLTNGSPVETGSRQSGTLLEQKR